MRIPTECPNCLAEMRIPDGLAGKTVKCRECGGNVRVPGAEREAEETAPARRNRDAEPEVSARNRRPRPRNKTARDDEERPRRKARPRRKSGGAAIWITLSVVLLVVVSAGAIALVRASKKEAGKNVAGADEPNLFGATGLRVSPNSLNRPAIPPGWVDFHHPNSLYWVYVPVKPLPVSALEINEGNVKRRVGIDIFESQNPTDNRVAYCSMQVKNLAPEIAKAYQTGKLDVPNSRGGPTISSKRVTWGGETATEVEVDKNSIHTPDDSRYYMRWVIIDDTLYEFTIGHENKTTPTDAERKAFFDSVVFGK